MNALWQVVVKEFLQLRQDKKMIPVLFIGPLVQLLVLSFAANLDVSHIPIVVVDHDRSSASRALVERFTSSGWFEERARRDDVDDAEPLLVEGKAQMVLVVAAGYGTELARGGRPAVQVVADGTDSNSAVVGLGYASRLIGEAGAEILTERHPGIRRRAQIELRPRVFYNPDLRSRWFYVPAVLAMVLMLVTMILPSMAVVREKEIGTLEQIIVTPLQPWQLIAGKLLPFVLIGIVDQLLICGLAVWVLEVPLRGSIVLLTGLTLLFLLCTLGLGLFVSSVVATQQQAMMFCIYLLMVPMIYLSGLIFPIDNMPLGFQYVTYVIPVRYYANILRGVFLKGSGLDVLWPDALALLAIGTTVLTFAALRFRKNLD